MNIYSYKSKYYPYKKWFRLKQNISMDKIIIKFIVET